MNIQALLHPPPRQRCRPQPAWLGALLALGLTMSTAWATAVLPSSSTGVTEGLSGAPEKTRSTADHSRFKALQGPFKSGSEVTQACLSCHTEAGKQVMSTRHWTWDYTNPDTGQRLGKKTMLNGFCIGDRSNEAFCQSCHVGYGWKDDKFDFHDESHVDCLVCHNTGQYSKPFGMAGEVPTERMERPDLPPGSGKFLDPVDLALVAKHIGKTSTATCGNCHYNGGGGDGVKHGDLDSSLNHATKALDVHMASQANGGAGFTCATCHEADGHVIAGSRIAMTASDPHGPAMRGDAAHARSNTSTCQSCHGDKPHKQPSFAVELLNNHTDKLACQSCHIPAFARGGVPTKMAWDWSAAGRLTADGKPFETKDEHGHATYSSKKGSFELAENVTPDYLWFNGKVSYTTQDMKIDPDQVVKINSYLGAPGEPGARIWPVKRFSSTQPYDKVHRQLLVPHTAMPDDTAYWFNFDWRKSLQAGADATGQPFSGEFGFVKTEMLWPITHMVAPASQAVACASCHDAVSKSRLGDLPGVYLPARDRQAWIDRLGWMVVLASLGGILLHAGARVLTHRRHTQENRHD